MRRKDRYGTKRKREAKMKLLIHDLPDTSFGDLAEDFTVISAPDKAAPCQGCFKCWTKNAGYCVYADSLQHCGALAGKSETIVVVSRLCYGGYSVPVKRFFDRGISDSSPFLTWRRGKTYHINRYRTRRKLIVYFYGACSEPERETAREYVARHADNMDADSCEVIFAESAERVKRLTLSDLLSDDDCEGNNLMPDTCRNRNASTPDDSRSRNDPMPGERRNRNASMPDDNRTRNNPIPSARSSRNILILNGSPKKKSSTSGFLGKVMGFFLAGCNVRYASLRLPGGYPAILKQLEDIDALILAVPLYVDGMPSHVLDFMQQAERFCVEHGCRFSLYVISNNGFIEGTHNKVHLNMYECWCRQAHITWGGGIGIGGGEMLSVLSVYFPIVFIVIAVCNFIKYSTGTTAAFSDWMPLFINLAIYLFFNCGMIYCMIRLSAGIRRLSTVKNRYTRVMVPSFLFVPMAAIFMALTALFQGKIIFSLLKEDDLSDRS